MTSIPLSACGRCGTELAPALLRCPSCGVLTHSTKLEELAVEARAFEEQGQASDALARWNEALALLPPDAPQARGIVARVERLTGPGAEPVGGDAAPKPTGLKGAWIGIASIVLLIAGKLKFLLLGFTKLGTVLSMLAFLGVYWNAFGWPFALGFVLSIYIHEMGHVASLRHYGIPASAPMFIPGLGAIVRLKAHPPTPGQDARVGLAGPIWGAAAAIGCGLLYLATGNALFAGLAHTGAVLNLFNLLPFWQLDGGRGVTPLTRVERILLAVIALGVFAVTHEAFVILVAIGLGVRAFWGQQGEGDRGAMLQFAGLLVVLGGLAMVRGGA